TAGGQRVFYYEADTVNKILYLRDKNTAAIAGNRGGSGNGEREIAQQDFLTVDQEYNGINKAALTTRRLRGIEQERAMEVERSSMKLTYETSDGSKIVLRGVNETQDSIYVVLNRLDRDYVL